MSTFLRKRLELIKERNEILIEKERLARLSRILGVGKGEAPLDPHKNMLPSAATKERAERLGLSLVDVQGREKSSAEMLEEVSGKEELWIPWQGDDGDGFDQWSPNCGDETEDGEDRLVLHRFVSGKQERRED